VLEGAKNGDGFVAAVEVQGGIADRRAIQPLLTIESFSHRFAPRRLGRAEAAFAKNTRFRQKPGSFFEEHFSRRALQIQARYYAVALFRR
jgi:hypothetical protein